MHVGVCNNVRLTLAHEAGTLIIIAALSASTAVGSTGDVAQRLSQCRNNSLKTEYDPKLRGREKKTPLGGRWPPGVFVCVCVCVCVWGGGGGERDSAG